MVMMSESYPYQAGLSVYGKLIAGRATIIDAARITPSDSLNVVFAEAQAARDRGGNAPISVWLLPQTYKAEAGDYSMHGIEVDGMAGTQIEFVSSNPVEVQLPSLEGYPNTRKVKTSVLGPYIRGDRFPNARKFVMRNCEFLGHTGQPTVAGDYVGLCVESDNAEFDRCTFRHDLSRDFDATAGVLSPFKAYSKRNFSSFASVQIGVDRWVEPDIRMVRPLSGARVTNCSLVGEPFDETSGGTERVTAIRMRKCHNSTWRDNQFGGLSNPLHTCATDAVFTGQPNNGELLLLTCWDPYLRDYVTDPIYTWVSGTPANAHEIKIGATVPESIRNAGNQVNANRVDKLGSSLVGALFSDKYIDAAQPSLQVLRFQGITIGEGNPVSVGNHSTGYAPNFGTTALVQTNSANITLRPVSDGYTRNMSWQWGFVQEDCFGGCVDTTSLGTDRFAAAAYLDVTTMADNDFILDPGSERGHKIVRGWYGELVRFGDAILDLQHAGWTKVHDLCVGQATFLGTQSGMIRMKKGTHSVWRTTMSANPANNETITVANDGHGGSAAFTWKTAGTADPNNPLEVNLGADGKATLKNLRKGIQKKFDDHTIKAFGREILGAGPWTLDVVFVTWTKRSATPSMTEASSNTTVADVSNPWKPRWNTCDIGPHALGDGATTSAPYLWAEDVQQLLTLRIAAQTARVPDESKSAQAMRSVAINLLPVGAEITEIILDSIHADGTKGAAVTFRLKAGGGSDTGTLKFIDTTINNTFTKAGAALALAMQTASLVDGRAFWGDDNTPLVAGAFTLVACYDGSVGVNANLVTKGTITTPNGAADVVLGTVPSAGNRNGLALASAATQGYSLPVVLKNCNMTFIEIQTEFHTASQANGIPAIPIYAEKASAGDVSKIHVRPSSSGTGWGRGRFGSEVFVLLGPNMVLTDVVCPAGSSYAEGRSI